MLVNATVTIIFQVEIILLELLYKLKLHFKAWLRVKIACKVTLDCEQRENVCPYRCENVNCLVSERRRSVYMLITYRSDILRRLS